MESGTCKSKSGERDSNSLARLTPWLLISRLAAPGLVLIMTSFRDGSLLTTHEVGDASCVSARNRCPPLTRNGRIPNLKRGLGCYEDENLESVPMESVARSSRPRTVSDPRKAARSRGRNRFRSGFERLAVFYGFSRIPTRVNLSSGKKWVFEVLSGYAAC